MSIRFCTDRRCRIAKRTQVYPDVAAALTRLSKIEKNNRPAEARRYRIDQCLDCQLWRLLRRPADR